MSRFVSEPGEVSAAGAHPPRSGGALLFRLGLVRASKADQRAGVARWLEEHEADAVMLLTLRAMDLIDDAPHRSHAA